MGTVPQLGGRGHGHPGHGDDPDIGPGIGRPRAGDGRQGRWPGCVARGFRPSCAPQAVGPVERHRVRQVPDADPCGAGRPAGRGHAQPSGLAGHRAIAFRGRLPRLQTQPRGTAQGAAPGAAPRRAFHIRRGCVLPVARPVHEGLRGSVCHRHGRPASGQAVLGHARGVASMPDGARFPRVAFRPAGRLPDGHQGRHHRERASAAPCEGRGVAAGEPQDRGDGHAGHRRETQEPPPASARGPTAARSGGKHGAGQRIAP